MKAIVCEMCSSNDVVKTDGVFVCQNCGTKYTVEEAKKLMIEGLVDVSGSTIKIDKSQEIKNYLTLAENARAGNDINGAVEYADKVLALDPMNYKAWVIKAQTVGSDSSLKENKIPQSIVAAKNAIEFAPDDEKEKIADSLEDIIAATIIMLISNATNLVKISGSVSSASPYYKQLILYWTQALKLPHVSKNKIRSDIKIVENLYNSSSGSLLPYQRAFYASCIVTNNSKPYHITMKHELLPDEMTDYEMARATKQGGCYVATAVYGSYDCPQVWILRRYRDYTLAETWYGRAFIHTYYSISPTLVRWFGHTSWFKNMWKGKLDRMVRSLQEKGYESTPYEDRNW